ncbi:YhcN/YlaJ family sporulation lipoprotein [Halalkalibacterium ligniniphilum]|uniref:YhcN/YlaJ family sporulation lipoprotein n=1 Tax=Halalkalibacterium ligniniphilum TaxID=1134413 RepID=UPI00034D2C12|nr:YhcN/YlaJ family sporulation lipoprotein [Halalkalibacterium ligniniphilum]
MVHFFRFSLTAMLLMIMLVGCAGQNNNQQGMDNTPNEVGTNDENRYRTTNDENNLINGNNDHLQDDGNVGDGNNGRTGMEIAEEAAERVAQLEEVRQANVLTTDNYAYVAALLEDEQQGELSEDIKDKIAQRVKEVDPDIDRVNVSTNPDFVDRIQEYADALERGEPVEGLFEQLNETIQRVFPTQE